MEHYNGLYGIIINQTNPNIEQSLRFHETLNGKIQTNIQIIERSVIKFTTFCYGEDPGAAHL